jgi:hypothetical protein
MSLRPARLCALKSILNSLALLTLLLGAATPGAWSQQSAKAAVVERPASPSDPLAGPETAAAVLASRGNSGSAPNEFSAAPGITEVPRSNSGIREFPEFTSERTL